MIRVRLGLIAVALLVLSVLAAACSSTEAPAPPTPTPINVAEIIQQTMQAQPQGLTAQDVASEIQSAMAGQQGVTPADVADAIASAMAQQQGVTPSDVAMAVQQAMASQPGVTQAEVGEAIAKALATQPGITEAQVADAIAGAMSGQQGVSPADVSDAITKALEARPGVTQADIAAAVESAVAKAAPAAMAPAADDSMMMVEEKDKYGGTLRVVSQASIKSLDPDFCTSYVCWAPSAGHLLEPLMTQAADFSTQPMLLDSWDVSDDGNYWTLKLREGIKFHDGTPLTSEAAVLSTKRVLVGTPAGEVLSGFLAEDGLQIVDDLTFSVETTEPYGSLLDGFALRTHGNVLVYTPTAAAFPMTEDVGEENIIGTGPYKLEKWDVGVKVTLARNEDYQSRSEPGSWMAGGKKVYLDKIEWLEIPSEETKVAGLKTGEWDFIDSIGLDFVADLKEDPDVGFTWYPGHMWYFGFNVSEEPMDNLLLRKAIQASMSGEDMLSAIGPPDTWKLNCSVYGSGTVFESDAGCELYNQNNIAKAKELLAESGYDGEPIVILNPTDYSTITPVGPVIKARMEEIGINVEMPGMDWATATSKRLSGEGWHIFTSWGTIQNRQNPALSFLLAGGGKSIGFGYYNEELHELHDKFLRATDFESQKMIADDMQRSFLNNPPQVYSGIFFMPSAYRTWVHDVPPEHPGTPYYANVWMSR